jgi:hypothetical protein
MIVRRLNALLERVVEARDVTRYGKMRLRVGD